ncbi:MAG: hypothetical protein LCH67_15645 [Bacteroidetes bacterium]|nr:hypothetical protein [Bacteroidota bacterium]
MKKRFIPLLISIVFQGSLSNAQNTPYLPTIYNSDYSIPPTTSLTQFNDSLGNVFQNIYFYEKEEFSGGFKERKMYYINYGLLNSLKGNHIIFNPNSLLQDRLYGFYKKPDLKSEMMINSNKTKYAVNQTPNIFKVLRVEINKATNEVVFLELKKINDDKFPVVYFSPKEFVANTQTKVGSMGDLGLITKEYLDFLLSKYQGKEYLLKYRNSTDINYPENASDPSTLKMFENNKSNKNKLNSKGLLMYSLYSGNAFYGMFGYMMMNNNFQKLKNNNKEFKLKQRNLLYDLDLTTNSRLSEADFGTEVFWRVKNIHILEESTVPVLLLENAKGKEILVFEELSDLMISKNDIPDLKAKYGQDIIEKVFASKIEYGYPIDLIRFSLGYENSQVSVELSPEGKKEIFGFQNVWIHLKDGAYEKQEWNYFRQPYTKSENNE